MSENTESRPRSVWIISILSVLAGLSQLRGHYVLAFGGMG